MTSPYDRYRAQADDAIEQAGEVEKLADQLIASCEEALAAIREVLDTHEVDPELRPVLSGALRQFLATRLGDIIGAKPSRSVPSLADLFIEFLDEDEPDA